MTQQAGVSTVASRVRTLRQRRGWSAQQLADACAEAGMPSLTRSTIAKLESGARKGVSAEEAAVLSEALGMPLSELMGTTYSAAAKGLAPTNPFQVPGWPLMRPLEPWREPSHREYYVDVGGSTRAFETFTRSMTTLTTFPSTGQTVLITGNSGTGKSALAHRCVDWTVQWLAQQGTRCVVVDLTAVLLGAPSLTIADRMSLVCQRLFDELRLQHLIQDHALTFLDSDRDDPHRFLPVLPLALVEGVALAVLLPAAELVEEVTQYAMLVRGPILLVTESSSLTEEDTTGIANELAALTPLIALQLKPIGSDDIRRFIDARLARSDSEEDAKTAYESIDRVALFPESIAELQQRLYETYEHRPSVREKPRIVEDATTRRQHLGRLLRRARKAAGLTQAAVATRLGCGQAKINKIETTLASIDLPTLEKLIELYAAPADEADELRRLAELDQRGGPARTKYSNTMAAFALLTEVEPEAHEILCWHSERLPRPLQSEMYILKQHGSLLTDDHGVTRVLRERAARTKVFTVPNPPRYRVILSESSLHRMPGGRSPQLVVDQIQHLQTLIAEHERLQVQILTFDADIPYVDSDFQLLRFAGPTQEDFAYIEYPDGGRTVRGASTLRNYIDHWNTLHEAALSLADSVTFLRIFSENFG
jgi:transcriptional regulator with XRE-family HTH domain